MKFTFICLYELERSLSRFDKFIEKNGKEARRLVKFSEDYIKDRIIATFKCLKIMVSE